MTVADPEEIGCGLCGALPTERCRTNRSYVLGKPRSPHALRKADAGLEHVEVGWVPGAPVLAQVLDLTEARMLRAARANGVRL